MIPVACPYAQYLIEKTNIDSALRQVLDSGVYILGSHVEAFESSFAQFCGLSFGISVGNGTDAIIIALRSLGIGPGDRVVTVSHTAVATVAAVLATGATPVLVDIDPRTYTLDPDLLEPMLDERVKAIIPVHLYGNPADLRRIREIAGRWDIPVVEDCAQATGAYFEQRRVGNFGCFGCFSFYPTKNLGALGDAGMLVTDDAELAERAARMRQYGWDNDRKTKWPGVNSRMDELQAAVLIARLHNLDAANRRRADIARRYSTAFADLSLATPTETPGACHVYHLYVVATATRSEVRRALLQQGVQSAIHYPVPVHRQTGYAQHVEVPPEGLPQTDQVVEQVLSLPIYPGLRDAEVDRVIAAVTSTCVPTERLR